MIDDIPNAKNMAREPEKHFFPQQSLVVHQTSAFYIVANPVRHPTIQIVLSQLVRANHKITVFLIEHMRKHLNSGTSCSYEDPHLFCIHRECKRVGCDHRIGSVKSYNNCGICGGSESDCDYVRLPKKKVARFRNSK